MILRKLAFKYDFFISIIILVSTLTAYAIIPTIPATVPAFLFLLIFIGFFIAFPINSESYKASFYQFCSFVAIFIVYALITQLFNYIFPVTFPQTITLIESSGSSPLLFRSTLYTQSAYLICNVFLYVIIKNHPNEKFIKYIFWTFRILILYGLYEFFYYLIFHSSGDFISNRIFSNQEDAVVGGSFQLQSVGPLILLRIKGFTGEPSMFSFVTLPYFTLLIGMRKKWEASLCFVCLLLTFSTSAYLGLAIYALYLIFFSSNKKLKYTVATIISCIIVLIALILATNEYLQDIVQALFINKLSGDSASGDERSGLFFATFNFWKNSDIFHLLFGYGFGYARSTDFLSTLLFNVGLLGFISFTLFIFGHFLIRFNDKRLQENYRAALIIIYFVMMASVPEFAYCSLWVVLASGYVFKNYNSNNIDAVHKF